jgi:hypothetical protein
MLQVIYPPNEISCESKTIFLGGSIEMGKAIDWQGQLIDRLKAEKIFNSVTILNPRRPDWNSNWEQTMDNPSFVEQVSWELQGLENADIIVMFLAANTNSPISLLELGLHAKSGKMIVFCEEGFSRKGNVDIVCKRYIGIKQVFSWDDLITEIMSYIN